MLPSFQQTQEERCSDVHVIPSKRLLEKSKAPTKYKGAEPLPSSQRGVREPLSGFATIGSSQFVT